MKFNIYHSSSKGNLYTLDDGETKVIIECGVTIAKLRKALKYKIGDYAGVLISHKHKDHCEALPKIITTHPCYALPDVFESFYIGEHYNRNDIKHKKSFYINTLKITPFSVFHDVPNVGYLISSKHGGNLLFATDCTHFKPRFNNLTHIAIECNYDRESLDYNVESGQVNRFVRNRVIKSHMSLDHTKDFLIKNDLSHVEQIFLIHCSSENLDKEKAEKQVRELTGLPVVMSI